MGKSRNLNFANFICHFGEKHEMLDLAEEIIIPAFMSPLKRKYSDTVYFFLDVALLDLGSAMAPVAALAGRLVKDTQIKREQILQDGALVPNKRSMASAPSAFFILVLNDHKLVYMPETKGAPSIEAFRATAQRFVSEKHKSFANNLYQGAKRHDSSVTRNTILEKYPMPIIEVVPLSSEASLDSFIDQFEVLSEIRVRLIDPNGELDNDELFDDLQQSKDLLGAKTTEVLHRNPKGMSKKNAVTQLTAAVQRGNTEVTISGKDAHGDKLSGNNERFKLSVPVKELPGTIVGAAKKLYESFKSVISDGILAVGKPAQDPTVKITKLLQRKL